MIFLSPNFTIYLGEKQSIWEIIYPQTIPLEDGLQDAAKWYLEHMEEVNKKPYLELIDSNFEI